ncbi:MAG TPA: ABC transporter ATP-binding protein [Candidatus Saccharimonadia bacterium]
MSRTNRSTQLDRQTLTLFWRANQAHRRLFFLSLLFPAGLILSNSVAPLFISKTLGALATPHGQPLHYLAMFVIAAGAGLILNRVGHPALMRHQAIVLRDLQSLALTALLMRSIGFHSNNIGGKLVSDAIDYPSAYGRLTDAIATSLVPLAITFTIGAGFIYAESWELGLFITATTLLIVSLGIYDSRRMSPRRWARLQAGKDVTAHLADTVTNINTVKTFGQEARELATHRRLNDHFATIRTNDWVLMSRRGNTRIGILVVLQALLIFLVVQLVQRDPTLLGVGIFAFTLTITLSTRLFEVNMLIRNIEEALLQASPMTSILQDTPEVQDQPSAPELIVHDGAIDFSHVTFTYHDARHHRAVFTDFNLQVAAGEKIGLVGPSGGGKSTLTRLLLRFDDINAGEISIDGQNIAAVTQASLRRQIAYVPQEPLLFHRSVGENIAYGQPDADAAAIKRAAALAHADEFIISLPHGYDTIVGERGVKLSGGQRQRVAIARAILKNAPILVLDEATSTLDSQSEALIQDALWKLMDGRTTLVIAHRLSTIKQMDRILVLNDGRIVEQGDHERLLSHPGLYARLWSHQSGGLMQDGR